jgi:hypothetical protein
MHKKREHIDFMKLFKKASPLKKQLKKHKKMQMS